MLIRLPVLRLHEQPGIHMWEGTEMWEGTAAITPASEAAGPLIATIHRRTGAENVFTEGQRELARITGGSC